VASWAGLLLDAAWVREAVCVGAVGGEVLVELWLLQGGVVLHWAGEPDGLSASMGDIVVGGLAAAA